MNSPNPIKRIRVIFISEGFPPVDGGVAISTQRIAGNLARLGLDVLVLTFDHTRPLTEDDYTIIEQERGFQVVRIGPFFRRVEVPEQAAAVARRRIYDQMEYFAKEFCPDIILSFYATSSGLLGSYIARRFGVPHVAGLRGNDVGRNIFSFYYLSVLHSVIHGSDWVVCVNDHLKSRFCLAFPEHKDRCSVIPNTVELPELADVKMRPYLAQHTTWASDTVVAVFIGMPREKKGIVHLLRAIAKSADAVPIRLLIVGPGLREQDVKLCAQAWEDLAQRDLIHCTGHNSRDRALQIAAEGDLIVMPSLEDGLANGLLEGMSLGLAPIMTDLFSDEISQAKLGWIIPRANSDALATALVNAVNSPSDRRRYARAAQEYVLKRHRPSDEASSYIELFQRLISQRQKTEIMLQGTVDKQS